jgi:hypothetical protein
VRYVRHQPLRFVKATSASILPVKTNHAAPAADGAQCCGEWAAGWLRAVGVVCGS